MKKTDEELMKDFKDDVEKYTIMNKDEKFKIEKEYLYPILTDKYESAGQINLYFWRDLWASRLIYKDMPETHYDIGSRIDGFITHLMTFHNNIKHIDIRNLNSKLDGVDFICADATNLEMLEDNSIDSLSALGSIEHFGLGRYGDPIDPDAHYKAFKAIQRVMKPGGNIYISVPVGVEKVAFNAHRIYNPQTISKYFSDCKLIEFSITCNDQIIRHSTLNQHNKMFKFNNSKVASILGLFHFRKK